MDSLQLETQEKPTSVASLLAKSLLFTLLFLGLFLILTLGAVGFWAKQQLTVFSSNAGMPLQELWQTAQTGWNTAPTQEDGHITFLVLGTDYLPTRGNAPVLTDTMLIASLNLGSGQVNLLPLPRDLWSVQYKTKINALYWYGGQRDSANPAAFPKEVLQEMTGVKFQHTIVVNLNQVSELIDLLGGIEVDVPEGFIDKEFPRPDVDVTIERDPAKLYQTIEFTQGKQLMNGERVLQYIRSRHSGDDQGDDIARGNRQQLVLKSLMARMRSREVLTSPVTMGKLLAWYQKNFAQQLPVTEAIAIGHALVPVRDKIELKSHQLSIFPDDPNGVITHPDPKKYDKQWVYEVRDQEGFRKSFKFSN